MERARSSASPTTRADLTPRAGSNSYSVTTGPGCTSLISPLTPKSASTSPSSCAWPRCSACVRIPPALTAWGRRNRPSGGRRQEAASPRGTRSSPTGGTLREGAGRSAAVACASPEAGAKRLAISWLVRSVRWSNDASRPVLGMSSSSPSSTGSMGSGSGSASLGPRSKCSTGGSRIGSGAALGGVAGRRDAARPYSSRHQPATAARLGCALVLQIRRSSCRDSPRLLISMVRPAAK